MARSSTATTTGRLQVGNDAKAYERLGCWRVCVGAALGAPVAVATVVTDQPGTDRALRRGLVLGVEGGICNEAGVEVGTVAFLELLAYPLGRVGCRQIDLGIELGGRDGRCPRSAVLGLGDRALLEHPTQHEIAPVERPLRPVDGVAAAGLLHDSGEHGELREVQLVNRLAVVGVGRRLDPVGPFAERHDVHVKLENLLLAELLLDLERKQHLFELPYEFLFG